MRRSQGELHPPRNMAFIATKKVGVSSSIVAVRRTMHTFDTGTIRSLSVVALASRSRKSNIAAMIKMLA